jgi:hypothetical protein
MLVIIFSISMDVSPTKKHKKRPKQIKDSCPIKDPDSVTIKDPESSVKTIEKPENSKSTIKDSDDQPKDIDTYKIDEAEKEADKSAKDAGDSIADLLKSYNSPSSPIKSPDIFPKETISAKKKEGGDDESQEKKKELIEKDIEMLVELKIQNKELNEEIKDLGLNKTEIEKYAEKEMKEYYKDQYYENIKKLREQGFDIKKKMLNNKLANKYAEKMLQNRENDPNVMAKYLDIKGGIVEKKIKQQAKNKPFYQQQRTTINQLKKLITGGNHPKAEKELPQAIKKFNEALKNTDDKVEKELIKKNIEELKKIEEQVNIYNKLQEKKTKTVKPTEPLKPLAKFVPKDWKKNKKAIIDEYTKSYVNTVGKTNKKANEYYKKVVSTYDPSKIKNPENKKRAQELLKEIKEMKKFLESKETWEDD